MLWSHIFRKQSLNRAKRRNSSVKTIGYTSWKILHTGFIPSALVLDVLHCWCSCINSSPAKLINQHVKAARLIWRGHKRGLNKWCGRGQVRANVKTSQLFVAAAGVAAGQQVSAQLKISAQGRRPAPPAAAAQLKMFWRTLNVQRNHVLWLRRFFSPPFLGEPTNVLLGVCVQNVCKTSSTPADKSTFCAGDQVNYG